MYHQIQLYSGMMFDFENLKDNPYHITDIAHALSNVCRWGGHVIKFYSVAQHSVLVSRLVEPKYALEGLMHDAAEAFIGDMPRPLKSMMPEYEKLERKIEKCIANHYSLVYPFPLEVRNADDLALEIEAKSLSKGCGFNALHQEESEKIFLERYRELRNSF